MTVSRGPKRINPVLVIGLVVLAVVVVAIGIGLGSRFAAPVTPAPDSAANARTKALEAAQGLELVTIEYPKVLRNEPSGTAGALARSQAAFSAARGDLTKLDAGQVDEIAAAFVTLTQEINARAPAQQVTALADATRVKLLALSNH